MLFFSFQLSFPSFQFETSDVSKRWKGALSENCGLEDYGVRSLDFFSGVINIFLTKLAQDHTGRMSALGLLYIYFFIFSLTLLRSVQTGQDLRPIFSSYGSCGWFIRSIIAIWSVFHFFFISPWV